MKFILKFLSKNSSFLVIFMVLIGVTNGYYVRKTQTTVKSSLVDDTISATIEILKPSSHKDIFPEVFQCNFTALKNKMSYTCTRIDGKINNVDSGNSKVYVKDGPNRVKEFTADFKKIVQYNCGSGIATLTDNQDINNLNSDKAFRALITINDENNQYEILPVLYTRTVSSSLSKSSIQINTLSHEVEITTRDQADKSDYLTIPNFKNSKTFKRSVSGQPVTVYVEVLVVADYSIFVKHQVILGTTDANICFLNMKIFFSQLVAAADLRYSLSTSSDPDLIIKLRLANFLFDQKLADSYWTSYSNVGVSGIPTYNGRDVVDMSKTLSAFGTMIKNTVFPFAFDHAAGFFAKDMIDASQTGTTGSGVVGLAWVGGVCDSTYKYSIQEDNGFKAIGVFAHELGHNLGSSHDGTTSNSLATPCPASDNYIMSAVSGVYSTNLQNYFIFSSCSKAQFKATLLQSNGPLLSSYSCLSNIPVNIISETTYFNTSLPGQLYNADEQCKLIIGATSDANSCNQASICTQLQCVDSTGQWCVSSVGAGALDGTTCGTNMICKQSYCVSNSVTVATNFPSNPCSVNPCQNGGKCIKFNEYFLCNCTSQFTGLYCQLGATTTTTTATLTTTTTTATLTTTTKTTTTTKITTTTTTKSNLTTLKNQSTNSFTVSIKVVLLFLMPFITNYFIFNF